MRYGASSISTTAGTPSGSVSDTRAQDDLLYVVTEDGGTGITSVFTISASSLNLIPDFLRVYGWYSGSGSHYITVSVYNFNTSAYVDVGRMQGGTSAREYLFALGSANYHDPVTGEIRVRFLHSTTTFNPAHTLNINAFCVEKAVTVTAIWDEVISPSQHNVKNSAAYKIWRNTESLIYTGIAVGGTANTIQLAEGTSAEDDGAYDPAMISIIGGTGVGQSRMILGYKGHPDHIAVVDRDWKVIPAADSEVVISANAGREHVNEGLAQGGGVNTITLNPNASPFDDAYNAQVIFLRSGQGQDQARRILDYDGATKVAIVSRDWAPGQSPNNTTAYVILPSGAISDNCIARAVWQALIATHSLVPGSFGEKIAAGYGLAPGSITKDTFAPGAVDANAIATDAVQEIQAGLATDDMVNNLPSAVRVASSQPMGSIPPVPTVVGTDLVLYRGASYDSILFMLSAEWIPYLQSEDPLYEVIFSAKRFYTDDDTKLLWSIPCTVVDAASGKVSATMTRTQTNHRIKTGLWQIAIRLVDDQTGEVLFARPAKEGRLVFQALVKTT